MTISMVVAYIPFKTAIVTKANISTDSVQAKAFLRTATETVM